MDWVPGRHSKEVDIVRVHFQALEIWRDAAGSLVSYLGHNGSGLGILCDGEHNLGWGSRSEKREARTSNTTWARLIPPGP